MGRVFDIKRYATGDGPGIRALVFLKGCPLTCGWCANPESQRAANEILYYRDRCVGCGRCVAVCPTGALTTGVGGDIAMDRSVCTACGRCVDACLVEAREKVGEERTAAEILEVLERDRAFYENSGGGITITGGEPLAQPEFTAQLLAACRLAGLHTALETSGFAEWEAFEQVVRGADLLYFDLKHSESSVHEAGTGQSNERILSNLSRVREVFDGELVVRIPYIPGFNDDEAVLAELFDTARRIPGLQRVEVLPYHRLGLVKYAALGRLCKVADLPPVERGALMPLRDLGRRHGVRVEIDGR